MSEIIRNLVSGKPMSRRDFLKKAAGGAILGATKDIPLPSAPPKIAEEAQQIADILKYVQLVRHPHKGIVVEELMDEMPSGQIAAIVSDALYGGDRARGVSAKDYQDIVLERQRAARALEGAAPLPTRGSETLGRQVWNPRTGTWEQEFDVYDLIPLSEDELNAERARRSALRRGDEQALESLAEEGPLQHSYQEFRRAKSIEGLNLKRVLPTDESMEDYMTLKHLGQAYGHVPWDKVGRKKASEPDEKKIEDAAGREQSSIRPTPRAGVRYSTPPSMQSEANAMGGMHGTPGEDHKETVGRIRRLLGVAAPVMAAGAASQQEQKR